MIKYTRTPTRMAPSAVEDTAPATAKNGTDKKVIKHSPGALAHVVLRSTTQNYQAMIQFYLDLLSAQIVHTTPVLTFLRYDEEHHRIAIIQTPETTPKPKHSNFAGLDHIAFTYPTLTQLAQQYTYLKSKPTDPLRPMWSVNHGPTTSMYYRDPDGNKVELQVDNFDVPEEADDFMKGPLYGMNPMGTDFDADEWAAEILSKATVVGEEGLSQDQAKQIKTRKEIGERQDIPAGF
ncbi:hypothetical protein LTR43_005174 [Exophiala xenobiotica]|nr:hypothetical protein LTR14_005451 [Exophiala xenobiotica]KAK5401922.1 hypothetical protein LTR06_010840 [Exophiala xenobiotica]